MRARYGFNLPLSAAGLGKSGGIEIGVTGFEPATPASRTQCSGQAELHPVSG